MEPIRVLDLFSGTGSIRKVCDSLPDVFECVSLDITDKLHPGKVEYLMDVMNFDYKQFKPGHFDIITASPSCTMYSIARTTAKTPRDILGSNLVVQRVIDIIKYLQPVVGIIENPATGMLKLQPMMQHIPVHTTSYCMYSSNGFRKLTNFWHLGKRGLPNFKPECCAHSGRCKDWCRDAKRHRRTFSSRRGIQGEVVTVPLKERYAIPEKLVTALLGSALDEVYSYRDEMAMLSAADTAFD